ncbi:hypothetical protein ABT173_21720 [Streptomyces sp. NPDC001795]
MAATLPAVRRSQHCLGFRGTRTVRASPGGSGRAPVRRGIMGRFSGAAA